VRVLFLAPFPPSPERPDALHHPRLLARHHDVTVVACYTESGELAAIRRAATTQRIVPVHLPRVRALASCALRVATRWPLYLAYYYNAALLRAIRQVAREVRPDVVHAHTLRMAVYASRLEAACRVCNIQDVLTTRYAGYVRQRRPSPGWALDVEEWLKLRRFEPALWRRMDRVAVVSENEAVDAATVLPGFEADVIRPGVDPGYFAPLADSDRTETIVLLGRFSYRPNTESALRVAKEIFPRVRSRRPSVRLVLVGSDPPPALRRLAGVEGIEVTGYVPDVRPYLGRAALSICPMNVGGGVKYKILQSLAMATPVVTNALGARGTGLLPGEEVIVAEENEALADACLVLLDDAAARLRIGCGGRDAVLRRHAWDVVGESLETFHQPRTRADRG
jgi:polysaccharide biosynthesis protein PslH